MELGKTPLELKKMNENIRNKFKLKKKEDLMAQFKEFKENPLININTLPE
jgi:hypothetical protein